MDMNLRKIREKVKDREAWHAIVPGVIESDMTDLATEQPLWVRRLFKNAYIQIRKQGFPWCSASKESACSGGDLGSVPGWGKSLEKGMATHPRILVWRIPWTEEPGGLQSKGLQSVRHD